MSDSFRGTWKVATAPCSWGVEDAHSPANARWEDVLDGAKNVGFDGIELGPYGYLPTNPADLRDAIEPTGLEVPAGFILAPLHDSDRRGEVENSARDVCRSLREVGATRLVVIASLDTERLKTSGRSADATRLNFQGWSNLLTNLVKVSAIAADHAISVSVHPHAGSYIEFIDEVEFLLSETNPDKIGLCLDTGHCAFAGIDPVALYREYASRVIYLHLKDVDPITLAKSTANRLNFWEAIAEKTFVPLGNGIVDFQALEAELHSSGYDGWLTVEQDRMPGNPHDALLDIAQSMSFLRDVGLAKKAA